MAKIIHSFAAENNKEKITTGRVEQVDIDQQVGSAFIVRRTNFDLKKAQARTHILEGQLKALDVFDEIIRIIRTSNSVDDAKTQLIERFDFSETQASAILNMRLTRLEREKLQSEYNELMKFIKYCIDVLGSYEMQMQIVKDETMQMKDRYGDERRTEIVLSSE